MTANELRKKYLEFFKKKGHAIIPSASLIPENDPTTLFISAGMHPLVPYLIGKKHPSGRRLVDSQKCIRTIDIEEVGDNRHLTFFEMLGNWSLGDYFKKEAIEWSWEFLTDKKWLGLDPKRIFVTVFAGDENSPEDKETIKLWKKQFEKIGISAGVCGRGEKAKEDSRIFLLGAEDNWWGPAGQTGPCGPCSEMFYDVRPEEGMLLGTHGELVESFRLMEFWNDVFMEFNKKEDGSFEKLSKQNVDTGLGLERTIAILSGKENIFDIDLFLPIIKKIEELSGLEFGDKSDAEYLKEKGQCWVDTRKSFRIIADHIKASVFIIADGVEPSNTQQGYVLRRLIRRAIRQGHMLGIKNNFTVEIAKVIQDMYGKVYLEILDEKILLILKKEEEKFREILEKGLKEFNTVFARKEQPDNGFMNTDKAHAERVGKIAFDLFQSYGFPVEMTIEEAKRINLPIDEEKLKKDFDEKLKKQQELSRTASAGMFKGGLVDKKEKTTELHTAAHLMLAALRKILGDHVHQKGSNINGERVRFDFSHPEKMTDEQKKRVENFVNEAIGAKVSVIMKKMVPEKAKILGAEGEFAHKYGDKVKVYAIKGFSKEICGGPHVKNTEDIKGVFKIKKEESSSAGVRRIKAVVE